MGYTDKETMRLTLRKFNRVYQIYKDDFDLELMLNLSRTTYKKAHEKEISDEEWF